MIDKQKIMKDDDAFRYPIVFAAKYLFKCLDILFKILGWLFVVIGLQILLKQADSKLFSVFVGFIENLYFASVTLFAFLLLICRRTDIGLPEDRLGILIAVLVKLFGGTLLIILVDPRFPLDYIVNKLIEMKIQK